MEHMTEIKTDKWRTLPWLKIEGEVFNLQKRIFRVSQKGRHENVHRIQQLLVSSRSAKLLAVRKAAEDSKGSSTPGVDGKRSLTSHQKLDLSEKLFLGQQPDKVRRVRIPKPGGSETRNLGIPTIRDRAWQHLIALALEPEWEARFSPAQYGFRKGRNCQDVLLKVRMNIQRSPKWVLDADIEKFFDRISHEALVLKLSTFPAMENAIKRILKAGVLDGGVTTTPESGTPQGGPLSPLLANITLTGLPEAISAAFPPRRSIAGVKVGKSPTIVIYADDFVVLHSSRDVILAVREFIEIWLQPLGLNLAPLKTRITHTLEIPETGMKPGFDFLGCHIRQFKIGEHQAKAFFKGNVTLITPSKKSQQRVYAKCVEIIDSHRPQKKRNSQYKDRIAKGKASSEEIIIIRLNRILRGWAYYHRYHNSKRTFSRLDHQLWHKIFRHVVKTHPRMTRAGIVASFFNGGCPWIFKVLGTEEELLKTASIPIKRHSLVRPVSYYNGDWAYWGKRLGKYPGIPKPFGKCLKQQNRKCARCSRVITRDDRVSVVTDKDPQGSNRWVLMHRECVDTVCDAPIQVYGLDSEDGQ